MIWFALSMPYLVGALALISLVHEPTMVPVPNASGVPAVRYVEVTPCTSESVECWRGFYSALMDLKGIGAALSDLKARTADGEPVAEYCHEIVHDIGDRAYRDSGSVARAYASGDPFCRAGYYHGVLEGAFGEDGEALLARLDSLCSHVPGRERYSYQYFSCVHGIGHGLMAFHSRDIFSALDGCATLSGDWEAGSCAGGVFMENLASGSEFRDDDLLYPCTAVEERFRDACYMMQTSHILEVLGGDFSEVFKTCRSVEEPRRTLCFESLGRDASGWAAGDIAAVMRTCSLGDSTYERDHCVIGAAIDFIQERGGDAALSLCEHSESVEPCTERVTAHLELQ